MEWKKEIAIMALVKQELAVRDAAGLWPYHLPALKASAADIAEAESHLGFKLASDYASFLRHANGWRGFIMGADLFGTLDLCGSHRMKNAWLLINNLKPATLIQSGFKIGDLFPVAASESEGDLFLMVKPSHPAAGTVIWYAEEEIDRFPSFSEYFLAAVDYNREKISSL
jgi:hypothetical protein